MKQDGRTLYAEGKKVLYIEKLNNSESVIAEWDDMLWMLLIEKATVYRDGKISFLFKDGTEVSV